jgi:hypothetical protein
LDGFLFVYPEELSNLVTFTFSVIFANEEIDFYQGKENTCDVNAFVYPISIAKSYFFF